MLFIYNNVVDIALNIPRLEYGARKIGRGISRGTKKKQGDKVCDKLLLIAYYIDMQVMT